MFFITKNTNAFFDKENDKHGNEIMHGNLIINSIPNNKLLLETDDENIDIIEIYQKFSEIKKISFEKILRSFL